MQKVKMFYANLLIMGEIHLTDMNCFAIILQDIQNHQNASLQNFLGSFSAKITSVTFTQNDRFY